MAIHSIDYLNARKAAKHSTNGGRIMRNLSALHELAALTSLSLFIGTLLLIVGMVGH